MWMTGVGAGPRWCTLWTLGVDDEGTEHGVVWRRSALWVAVHRGPQILPV